jgi:2,3-dihydroxy-p-cumate/2,3-dihydroxybenzoate 3,4-dioxygenase
MGVPFRYRQLGYLALGVSDVERVTAFLTDVFGMDVNGTGENGARFLRVGPRHHDVILVPSKQPSFIRSSWELETEDDVDRAFGHYRDLGWKPQWLPGEECAALKLDRAFRMTDPILGVTWEYYAQMTFVSTPRQNILTKFQGGKHFGFAVPDPKAMVDELVADMGFLVSDYIEGWPIALVRAFPNPNHHSFAPVKLPGVTAGFHHFAFMVEEIDDIGRLFNRIKRFDVGIQFGIGRHPTSRSIHLYIHGPDYFVWEYTLGMEQFPEVGAREPRRMSAAPEDFDLWGAVPDGQHNDKLPALVSALF